MTKEELTAFEEDIKEAFNRGEIPHPVHLAGGNEDQLIEIFEDIKPDDWVLCTWRAHYHCLLKGVEPDALRKAIHTGRSIALCFPSHRIISSAIVGGIAPIAVGLAWSIKRRGKKNRIWCFIGDMAELSGIVQECHQYSFGHQLPITWVTENNGKSVCTDTNEVWGEEHGDKTQLYGYDYELTWPHVGTGSWVRF